MKKLSKGRPYHSDSPIDHLEREIGYLRRRYDDETVVDAIIGALHHIKREPEYFEWHMDDSDEFPPAGNDSGPATIVWGSLARCVLAAEKEYNKRGSNG